MWQTNYHTHFITFALVDVIIISRVSYEVLPPHYQEHLFSMVLCFLQLVFIWIILNFLYLLIHRSTLRELSRYIREKVEIRETCKFSIRPKLIGVIYHTIYINISSFYLVNRTLLYEKQNNTNLHVLKTNYHDTSKLADNFFSQFCFKYLYFRRFLYFLWQDTY